MNFLSICLICRRTDYCDYVGFYMGLHAHAVCLCLQYGGAKIERNQGRSFYIFEFDLERGRNRPHDECDPPQLTEGFIEHVKTTGHNTFSYKQKPFCISCYYPEELKPSHEWYAYWNPRDSERNGQWEVRAPKQIKGNFPDPVICTITYIYKPDTLRTRDLVAESEIAQMIAKAGTVHFGLAKPQQPLEFAARDVKNLNEHMNEMRTA